MNLFNGSIRHPASGPHRLKVMLAPCEHGFNVFACLSQDKLILHRKKVRLLPGYWDHNLSNSGIGKKAVNWSSARQGQKLRRAMSAMEKPVRDRFHPTRFCPATPPLALPAKISERLPISSQAGVASHGAPPARHPRRHTC